MKGVAEHPLQQIAESPTHKLLLKQWLKEEEQIVRRSAAKEGQIERLRHEIAALYCAFFFVHSVILVLLFASRSHGLCRRSWVPCFISLLCSMTVVWAVRYKTDLERHVAALLEREEEDGMLLKRCVCELKRKGLDFDLLKEVDALRRAKSLRVAAAAGSVGRWSGKDLSTILLLLLSCAVLGLTRYVLCH